MHFVCNCSFSLEREYEKKRVISRQQVHGSCKNHIRHKLSELKRLCRQHGSSSECPTKSYAFGFATANSYDQLTGFRLGTNHIGYAYTPFHPSIPNIKKFLQLLDPQHWIT